MSIPVERGLKLVVEYGLAGNRFTCGWVFTVPGAMGLTSPQALVTAFMSSTAYTQFLACLSVEAAIYSVYCYALVPGTAIAYRRSALVTDVGTISGDPAPSNLAAVVTLVQAETSSKANGRFYVSGFGDSSLDPGTGSLTSGYRTLLSTFASTMLAGIGSLPLGVFSKFEASAPRVPPVIFEADSVVVRTPVRQQRRRVTEQTALS